MLHQKEKPGRNCSGELSVYFGVERPEGYNARYEKTIIFGSIITMDEKTLCKNGKIVDKVTEG